MRNSDRLQVTEVCIHSHLISWEFPIERGVRSVDGQWLAWLPYLSGLTIATSFTLSSTNACMEITHPQYPANINVCPT